MPAISVDVRGVREMARTLSRLPQALRKAAETAVLRAGATPIMKAAKARVPTASGLLKKSVGLRVATIKGVKSARVGPRKGFKGKSLGMKKNKSGVETERFADPNKYSHLVEFGTSHSPAKPFIRPAIDAASGEVLTAMTAGLDKHLTKVAARLASR